MLTNSQHKDTEHNHTSHYRYISDVTESNIPETTSKHEVSFEGIAATQAYTLIRDELKLDGNPTLNLASFVNTVASESASKLIHENLVKNLADNDEYPITIDLATRCISMLSQLWNGHIDGQEPLGCPTTGSSEAIMLGGLAMKTQWEMKMEQKYGEDWQIYEKDGKMKVRKPNILMSSAAQVALEKFARYFEVEERILPVTKESQYSLDLNTVRENVDENTIGIFVIQGTTYTGFFEPVKKVNDLLDEIEKEHGWDIPIHVDGASGGFVCPFSYPEQEWDFRVPRVVSINTSGHKFGLTTAGLGWIIWRDNTYLPDKLRFKLKYLGGIEETFNLNFSRPGFQVINQFYNFLHLGFKGYKNIQDRSIINARWLSMHLEATGNFEVVSCVHKPLVDNPDPSNNSHWTPGLPVVSFRLNDEFSEKYPHIPQAILSTLLRNKGWIIPNYPLPMNEEDTEVLRVVCRMELTEDLLVKLFEDINGTIKLLISSYEFASNATVENIQEHIYGVLLGLSGDTEVEQQVKKFHEHKKNYRGTC